MNASDEARRYAQRVMQNRVDQVPQDNRPVAAAEWIHAGRLGGFSVTETRVVRYGVAFSARALISACYEPLFAIQVIIEIAKLAGGSVAKLISAKPAAVLDWCWQVAGSTGYFTLAQIQADAPKIMKCYGFDYLDASQVSDCIGVLENLGSIENCELGNYRVIEEVTWWDKKK
jgi:hypothetical protein